MVNGQLVARAGDREVDTGGEESLRCDVGFTTATLAGDEEAPDRRE